MTAKFHGLRAIDLEGLLAQVVDSGSKADGSTYTFHLIQRLLDRKSSTIVRLGRHAHAAIAALASVQLRWPEGATVDDDIWKLDHRRRQ